jgi:hypothetical protein
MNETLKPYVEKLLSSGMKTAECASICKHFMKVNGMKKESEKFGGTKLEIS